MKTQNNNTFSLVASVLLVLSTILIVICPNASAQQAVPAAVAPNTTADGRVPAVNWDLIPKVCMVYVETPKGEQPTAFHLRTLGAALGSEQAAKDGLIYSYTEASSGFTAFFNAEQQKILQKQPGVLAINCSI